MSVCLKVTQLSVFYWPCPHCGLTVNAFCGIESPEFLACPVCRGLIEAQRSKGSNESIWLKYTHPKRQPAP